MASDDAFPKVTTDQIEGDTEGLFSPDPILVEVDLLMAIYQRAHEAEDDWPGFIRDSLRRDYAWDCAYVDDLLRTAAKLAGIEAS